MFDLKAYLTVKQGLVDTAIARHLNRYPSEDRITRAMTYSLTAGGKRLRPILCLAAAETVGGAPEHALQTACALEMIHTYSLIHDDLPAMDNDALRRGKPTCHVAFDEATAILAGDALLTLAFQMLSSHHLNEDLPPTQRLQIINIISHAAGFRGMIEGQMRDMIAESKQLTLDELKALHSLKTGALIEAAITSGGIIGGGNELQIRRLDTYAKHIGLAFQIQDDILNVEGDPKVMGKAAGTDNHRNKNTFPSLIGLAESRRYARQLIDDALQALTDFDIKANPLRDIARYIIERKK